MKKIIKILVVLILLLTTACKSPVKEKVIKTKVFQETVTGFLVRQNEKVQLTNPEETSTAPADNSTKPVLKKDDNEIIDVPTVQETPTKPVDERISVAITIDCKTILDNLENLKDGYQDFIPEDGILLKKINFKVEKGSTVLDILKLANKQHNLNLVTKKSLYGGDYIVSIKNISEKICGMSSGWMYSVNGVYPGYSSSDYKLKDGDLIKWRFTCEYGDVY